MQSSNLESNPQSTHSIQLNLLLSLWYDSCGGRILRICLQQILMLNVEEMMVREPPGLPLENLRCPLRSDSSSPGELHCLCADMFPRKPPSSAAWLPILWEQLLLPVTPAVSPLWPVGKGAFKCWSDPSY